jgi:hypothetical protein
MTGQDSKSKKDNGAVTPETWTDASMKSKEERVVSSSPHMPLQQVKI